MKHVEKKRHLAIKKEPPDVLALSNYSWNSLLSERVAEIAKQINPKVITVQGGPNFPHDLGIFAIKIGRLVEVFLEVIQLAGRSVLLDLAVGYVAVLALGESNGGRPPEGMLSAPDGGESTTAAGSNVHPPALADGEMSRLPGS